MLISKEELQSKIADEIGKCHIKAFDTSVNVILQLIRNMPAADVQPVRRGEWIVDNDFYTCSRCNHQYLIDKILSMTIYPSGGMPYYCPCCGADMREPLKR